MNLRWRRRKAGAFAEVLARCLALLDEGASVESCLTAYPAHAARLEPLLRTAVALQAPLAAEPDAAFVARTRARFLAAAATHQTAAVPAPAPERRGLRLPLLRPLTMAGVALTLTLVAGAPIAATSSAGALPGDWNYGIKRGTERVKLALNFTDHLALADERAEEVRQLAERGRYAELVTATRDYEAELRNARRSVDPSAVTPAEARKVEERVIQQQAHLAAAGEAVQEQQVQLAAAQPGAAPPPAVVEARQATQSALNSAVETQQDIQQVAAAAQARATASPAPTAAPARSATVARGTATPAASVTPVSSASALVTPGAQTAVPAAGTGTPTVVTIAGTPSATAEPSPVATPSPAPATTRSPEPTATAEPAATATRVAQPSATPAPTPAATATRAAQPSATPAPTPAATATRVAQPSATPAPTPADDGRTRTAATPEATPTPPLRVPLLDLAPGQHTLVYNGPTAVVDQVFAAFRGKLAWIEWTPPGVRGSLRYLPGDDGRYIILTGSSVTLYLTDGVVIPVGPLTLP